MPVFIFKAFPRLEAGAEEKNSFFFRNRALIFRKMEYLIKRGNFRSTVRRFDRPGRAERFDGCLAGSCQKTVRPLSRTGFSPGDFAIPPQNNFSLDEEK